VKMTRWFVGRSRCFLKGLAVTECVCGNLTPRPSWSKIEPLGCKCCGLGQKRKHFGGVSGPNSGCFAGVNLEGENVGTRWARGKKKSVNQINKLIGRRPTPGMCLGRRKSGKTHASKRRFSLRSTPSYF
jgi:hypothetical protein